MSLMPLWQANLLEIDVKLRRDIVIRGADGQPLAVQGTGEVWVRDPMATFWKKVKLVVTREGSWTLISPKDKKDYYCYKRTIPGSSGWDAIEEVTKRLLRPMEAVQTRVCQVLAPTTLTVKRRTKMRTL